MKGIAEKFVEFAKELPGFGLSLLILTMAYTYLKGEEHEQPSALGAILWV